MAGLGVADWTPREGSAPKQSSCRKTQGRQPRQSASPVARRKSHDSDGHGAQRRTGRRRSASPVSRRKSGNNEPEAQVPPSSQTMDVEIGLQERLVAQALDTWGSLSMPKEFSLDTAQMLTESSREHLTAWFSSAVSRFHVEEAETHPVSPPKPEFVAKVGKILVSHWPPERGYNAALNGWQYHEMSTEWLYKPAIGIYFHKPSETLWKRAPGDRMKFVRIDDISAGLESIAILAFGDSTAGRRALRRACFFSWRKQLRKFEDMDRDLSDCHEARMQCKPRASASRAGDRGDMVENMLIPAATSMMKFLAQGEQTNFRKHNVCESRSLSASERSSSPESSVPVSQEILRLRKIARGQ